MKPKSDKKKVAEDYLPLSTAVFHLLLALADQERHGYGIMQEAKECTGGQVRLVPGTLYGAIKRLLSKGLIEEARERLRAANVTAAACSR